MRCDSCCRRFPLLVFLAACAATIGCGGGPPGAELGTAPPKPRAVRTSGETIQIPGAERFSIALAPATETPGLGGQASAEARVDAAGSANVTAEVTTAGSATAGFQLGHSFKNDTDQQMTFAVRAVCEYETSAETVPPATLPEASVSLKLFVRGGQNQLLRQFGFFEHTTESGAVSGANREQLEFSLTVPPRETIHIFFAGFVKIEVDADSAHTARGSISARDVTLEVIPAAAPPVSTERNGG